MKSLYCLLLAASLVLAGCFETTEEITIRNDGTGTLVTTSDMSSVLGLAKQMGGGGDMDKMMAQQVDTTISLASQADSIQGLDAEGKQLIQKGTMYMKLDMKDEKCFSRLSFPFDKADQIVAYNKICNKMFASKIKELMADNPMAGGTDSELPEISSFDDYYTVDYSRGEIKRSLNKEKYAGLRDDKYLGGLKETAGMGIPVTVTYIYNLPSPATKVEGKNAKLSEDKMKVTIKTDIDDLFDNPESLEFKIKY